MNVLAYLNGNHTLQDLEALGVYFAHIKEKNVYILNYDQMESNKHKTNDLVRDCRSLIVRQTESGWILMARSFRRFFNYGEHVEESKWVEDHIGECTVTEKKDGSLITVTHFDNEWHIFTRGSNADTNPFRGMQITQSTDSKELKETFGSKVRKFIHWNRMNPEYTYVFELCVPGSHITQYDTECISLLTVIDKKTNTERPPERTNLLALENKWDRPEQYTFATMSDLWKKLKSTRCDFEGYVVQHGDTRVKIKKDDYKRFHLLGSTQLNDKGLVRVCLMGEIDEFLTIQCLGKYRDSVQEWNIVTQKAMSALATTWDRTKDIPDQKAFALAIQKDPWKPILFLIRGKKLGYPILFRDMDTTLVDKCVDIVKTIPYKKASHGGLI
jgi:hypothetical protein